MNLQELGFLHSLELRAPAVCLSSLGSGLHGTYRNPNQPPRHCHLLLDASKLRLLASQSLPCVDQGFLAEATSDPFGINMVVMRDLADSAGASVASNMTTRQSYSLVVHSLPKPESSTGLLLLNDLLLDLLQVQVGGLDLLGRCLKQPRQGEGPSAYLAKLMWHVTSEQHRSLNSG